MFEYIEKCKEILKTVIEDEGSNIEAAAEIMMNTLKKDGLIHVSGGHCQFYAMEAFYRAGGLVPINPLLPNVYGIGPRTAFISDHIYEVEGVGAMIFNDQVVNDHDCIILASIAGRTIPTVDIALAAKKRGLKVIALQSMECSSKTLAKHSSGKHLSDVADVVIDLHIPYGDAVLEIDGMDEKSCPASSVIGFSVMQALVTQTICELGKEKITPKVWVSSNLDQGDAINKIHIQSMKGRVSCL